MSDKRTPVVFREPLKWQPIETMPQSSTFCGWWSDQIGGTYFPETMKPKQAREKGHTHFARYSPPRPPETAPERDRPREINAVLLEALKRIAEHPMGGTRILGRRDLGIKPTPSCRTIAADAIAKATEDDR